MALTPLPPLDRTSATFRSDVDLFFGTRIPQLVSEINATEANMSAYAAGGAYAIPYTFDAATTADDPTPGKLRLNNAAQSSATALHLDLASSATQDVSALLDQLDASTSAVKGKLRLVRVADPDNWLTFDVTARTSLTGYRTLTISNGTGSVASPFVNGDSLVMLFQRTGDKGEMGPAYVPQTMYMRDQQASGVGGQTLTSGSWNLRRINTVVQNDIPSASLSANQFTLPAGKYWIDIEAAGYNCDAHRVRLYNVTDSVITDMGSAEHSPVSSNSPTWSKLRLPLTIAATKVFKIEHYSFNNGSGGVGTTGQGDNIYLLAKITKVAS